jgi:hypothetical protein
MMLDQAPNGCQDNSCGQPDKARRPLTHPQLAMMHFVYEIRVTLSTKIFHASGLLDGGDQRVDRVPSTLTPSRQNFRLWRQATRQVDTITCPFDEAERKSFERPEISADAPPQTPAPLAARQ